MPYEIAERDDKFCVINSETGEVVKCHATREQATAHMQALYANVSDATSRSGEGNSTRAIAGEHDYASNALRAVNSTATELRVANYIVLFGGRDLSGFRRVGDRTPTRRNADGSSGEYFTPRTDFNSPFTALGKFPVTWEHGAEELPLSTALGYVDWPTHRVDERGIFVERVLDRRNKYVRWIEELLDAGLIGSSSEADPRLIEVGDNGEIKRWGLMGDTLTVQPAEPRNLTENQVVAYKALLDSLPSYRSRKQEEDMDNQTDTIKSINTTLETIQKRLDSIEGALSSEPPTKAIGIQVNPDQKYPYRPFVRDAHGKIVDASGYGEFLQDVAWAASNPGRAPSTRLVAAHEIAQKAMKAAGLNAEIPSQGGYFVQTDHNAELLRTVFETGKILSRVQRIPLGLNSDSVVINGIDETSRAGSLWGGINAYWIAEGGAATATKPKFREVRLEVHGLAALYYATDKLLRLAPALGALVAEGFREAITFRVEDAIINGDGAGKPLGILSVGSTVVVPKETGQPPATIKAENLSKMWARLLTQSKSNAIWLINTDTNPQLDQLVFPAGSTTVEARFVDYGPTGVMRIKGREVIEVEHCATLGTKGDIILWDPSTYLFTDLGEVAEASSIHVNFLTAESVFRFLYYCDGQPMLANAITPAKGAATLSSAVVLETRA